MSQACYPGIQHCLMILVFDSFYSTPSINYFVYYQQGNMRCNSGILFLSLNDEKDACSKLLSPESMKTHIADMFSVQRTMVSRRFVHGIFLLYICVKTSVG